MAQTQKASALHWHAITAGTRVMLAAVVGAAAGIVAAFATTPRFAPMLGWDAAALVFLIGSWHSMWGVDATETARRATREDPSTGTSDAILLAAAVASLLSVALVLFGANQSKGGAEVGRVLLGVASVALSWAVVHMLFCLKYARLYYGHPEGGIDFSDDQPDQKPTYLEFAYIAFTVGMTFQVSDTSITARPIRATVLRHALLSFLFGTVILSVTINLVAGLSK